MRLKQFTSRCTTPPWSRAGVTRRHSWPQAIFSFTLAPTEVTACPLRIWRT